MTELSGKLAWVTGASSGIGAATAKALAENGARVILSARRESRLKDLAQKINEARGHAVIKSVMSQTAKPWRNLELSSKKSEESIFSLTTLA